VTPDKRSFAITLPEPDPTDSVVTGFAQKVLRKWITGERNSQVGLSNRAPILTAALARC